MAELLKHKVADFDDMMFNVMKSSTSAVLTQFPALAEYEEFTANLGGMARYRSNIIRYIVLMYDRNSPFMQMEDIHEKKIKCALLAKFKAEKKNNGIHKHFDPAVDKMIKGYNETVNRMVIRYCRMQGSTRFTMIMASRDTFYDLAYRVLKRKADDDGKEGSEKVKLISSMNKSIDEIDEMAVNLFQGDYSSKLIEDLYVVIEEGDIKSIRITPESRLNVK
jgi:hypothetical protein